MIRWVCLPEPPSANVYWRSRCVPIKGKPRPGTPAGRGPQYAPRVYPTDEADQYKRQVGTLLTLARVGQHRGPVLVRIDWFRRIMAGDLDNRQKVLLDALKPAWIVDDKQIEGIIAQRTDKRARPGRPHRPGHIYVAVEPWHVDLDLHALGGHQSAPDQDPDPAPAAPPVDPGTTWPEPRAMSVEFWDGA